jgi:hypothetical protein
MDIYKAIRELHAEKLRLDGVIASLEEWQKRGDSSAGAYCWQPPRTKIDESRGA